MKSIAKLLCAGLLLIAGNSDAVSIAPTSYSMPNGYGQASGGTFNYWDKEYNGLGNTMTDGAALSGGLGNLTDGIIAAGNWNAVENAAGTGLYVGWLNINPTITFNFAATQNFSNLRIYFDDSDGSGGVSAPLTVAINNITYTVSDPAGAEPFFADFNISGITSDQLTVTLNRGDLWVFASEFQFDTAAVPEPSSWLLFGLGVLFLRRRLTGNLPKN